MTLSLRRLSAFAGVLLALAYGLAWLWAGNANHERLRAFRQAVREQGEARGGRPPTDDEARERTEQLGVEHRVSVTDVSVEHADVDGLPGMLGQSQVGAAVLGVVQVRSRQYTVRGEARSKALWFTVDESFELQFSVRLSVTMPSSIESHQPSLPSEPTGPRGL